MAKNTDNLISEILENVRDDRKNVIAVRDQIVKLATDPMMSAEPLGVISIADNIAKLSDVLTKMNSQLVELAKVSSKRDSSSTDTRDVDGIFDEIESNDADSLS